MARTYREIAVEDIVLTVKKRSVAFLTGGEGIVTSGKKRLSRRALPAC